MKICVFDFIKKAELLKSKIFGKFTHDEFEKNISASLCTENIFTVFFSVSDTHTRAKVIRFTASSLSEAWSGAQKETERFLTRKEYAPEWVKADIITKSERITSEMLIETVSKGYNECFRRGISFDSLMKTAMIEAEINGNRVISYKEHTIKPEQVNKYLASACGESIEAIPDEVIVFDCKSAFCDEKNNTFLLYEKGDNCGRRKLRKFNKSVAHDIISTSSEYLSMQLDFQGRFRYGVYPIYDKLIPGYNILRHASSIWSLVCAYRITKDRFILQQCQRALNHLVKHSFYKYKKPRDEENTAYIADIDKMEVKLGGNAVAIIVFTEYMNVTGSEQYKKLCVELGNGILELLDRDSGEFSHVLSIPSLELKEKTRTVYYDGEAVFALARLYGLTNDKRWLDAACCAVERFIREDYTKHRDHWVAYAMNEITKYVSDERYLTFGLRNAGVNLKKIYNQKTTYHTYLELLCVTFELYSRITENKIELPYLKEFDADYFVKTIFHRADFMLNGYCYPEYVMYLKYPETILGAFFVRHDGYRIRIDDIQHFCGAYYSLYRNYEKLDKLRGRSSDKK